MSLLEKWLKKSKTGGQTSLYALRHQVLELNEMREDPKTEGESAEPQIKAGVPEVLDDLPVQLKKTGGSEEGKEAKEGEEASASGSAQGGVMAERVEQLEEMRKARRKGRLSRGGGGDSSSSSYESSSESEDKKDAAAEKEEEKNAAEKGKGEEEFEEIEVETEEKDAAAKEEEEKNAAEKGKEEEEPRVFDPDTGDLWSLMSAYDEWLEVDFRQLTDRIRIEASRSEWRSSWRW